MVVMTVLPVQVTQHVMLGEHEARTRSVFGKEFWRYLGLCLALGVGCFVLAAMVIGAGFLVVRTLRIHFVADGLQWGVWGAIAFCLVIFVATRLSLLFCHVAIGRRTYWRASWNDTRGYFWRILVSYFLTVAPLDVCMFVTYAIVDVFSGAANRPALSYLLTVGVSLFTFASLIVSATCACWLYQRLARTLLAVPGRPAR
jgi:hypothetical protein